MVSIAVAPVTSQATADPVCLSSVALMRLERGSAPIQATNGVARSRWPRNSAGTSLPAPIQAANGLGAGKRPPELGWHLSPPPLSSKALDEWKGVKVQRCTVHKLRNLIDACPVHARREMQRDYQRITHADDGLRARKAYGTFLAKWSQLCPPVARSLEEAGQELLTFYEFPKAMWKSLRSTPNTTGCTANAIENLNREFRRRTKTQASFSTEAAGITLLYGLIAFGQIQLNKIQGFRDLVALGGRAQAQAA